MKNGVRSRRPPTFATSNRDINNERDITNEGLRQPASQEVKTLPIRRTVGGNSERIQVCTLYMTMCAYANEGRK